MLRGKTKLNTNKNMKLEEIGFYTMYDERAKNSSPVSQMKRCELILLEACNLKCIYCRGLDSYIYGERIKKALSFDEVKRNIDFWCENQPLESIRFSGGEPTLHKNIVEIVEYAKFKGIKRIAISSNGSNKIELYKRLIDAGVNDFSISLDACCADVGDKMAGGVEGAWEIVVKNIREISELTYVTVGVVLTQDNIDSLIDTIKFAHDLGVADIRIISAAQYNRPLTELESVPQEILDAHPILKFRVNRFIAGQNVRGMSGKDSPKCALAYDDSIIAGDYVFPCIIYMREKGKPICRVGPHMREQRVNWANSHNCFEDPICQKNCLEICIAFNNKFRDTNPLGNSLNESEKVHNSETPL